MIKPKDMKLTPWMLPLIFSLIIFSCQGSKSVTSMESEQSTYFIVGTGGGFTGLYNQYKIYQNGIIENYDFSQKSYRSFKKVKPTEVEMFFKQIKELNLSKVDFNKPGNVSDYIDVLGPDQKLNRIQWANSSTDISPDIIRFHENAMRLIKDKG